MVEKGSCNESAATINLKGNEISTRGLLKKLTDFLAHKRQIKHTSRVMQPSIPFHTLVKLVDVQDTTNEKIRSFDPPPETDNVTSKLDLQNLFAENYDPTSESLLTQTTNPNKKNISEFRKHCI